MKTSINDGHDHDWNMGDKFTSVNDGHKHQIDLRSNLAVPARAGGHFHTLRNGGIK